MGTGVNAWGASWGVSWGDSWGAIETAAPGSGGGHDVAGSARRLRQQFELDQDNLAIAMTICAGVALDMM